MIKRIDHIGIAVRDTGEALRFYADALGIKPTDEEISVKQGVKITFLPVGESKIELIEPIDPDSTTTKFLDTRGEGIHHLCLEVEGIESMLKTLVEQGFTLINEEPVPGAHNKKVAFVHPKAANGVLLELAEPADER